MSDKKHSLKLLPNDKSYLEDPEVHNILGFFICQDCGRHFYILKSELYNRIAGLEKRPLRFTRDMILQDDEGEWQLVFTMGT